MSANEVVRPAAFGTEAEARAFAAHPATARLLFDHFDAKKMARYTDAQLEKKLLDARIVRNRLKVQSIIKNARAYLALEAQGIDFAELLWGFVGGAPIVNQRQGNGDIPATSPESDAMAKALKKLGFTFVGSTICYAFMQAVGMVNDHLVTCPCHAECQQSGTPE